MVKKLIKHEFIYYVRTLGIFLPIVIAIGAMTRVFFFFDNGNIINELAQFSSSAMLVIASCALLVMSMVVSIVRFYKNMYSSEGYLTFTLPVTNAQHIFVKLLAAMVCQLVSIVTIALAAMIALLGERLKGVFYVIVNLFETVVLSIDPLHASLYIVEYILIIIISAVSTPLLYYTCITVGQTAKKNRILLAVGAYFVYYMASQAISTVMMIAVLILGDAGALDWITELSARNPYGFMHGALCLAIVLQAALAAAFYFITHRIMTKKLNLE